MEVGDTEPQLLVRAEVLEFFEPVADQVEMPFCGRRIRFGGPLYGDKRTSAPAALPFSIRTAIGRVVER